MKPDASLYRMAEEAGLIFGATSEAVVLALDHHLHLTGSEKVCDIGSGVGDFILPMARLHPEMDLTGIETMEEYVRISRERMTETGADPEHVHFLRMDALEADYGAFDVIYLYCPLSDNNRLFRELAEKLAVEMKPGAVLACFSLDMADPDIRKLFEEDSGMAGSFYIRRETFLEKYAKDFEFDELTLPEEECWHPNRLEMYRKK